MNITRYTGATAEIDLNDDVNKHCGIGNGQHRVRLAQALVGALFGVDHPLAEDIVQVTCGKTIKVSLYVPIGTKTEDIDSFATALRSAAVAHTSAVATKVNRRIAPRA